jgi:uncharacterized protein YoxC
MDFGIFGKIIPILIAALVAVCIWLVVEVVIVVRKARGTIDKANEVVDNANELVSEAKTSLEPTLARIDPIVESVQPAAARLDPIVEHAQLTVDAANVEIMRLDQILDDVQKVTNVAGKAATSVDKVTAAPAEVVTNAVERLRGGAKESSRQRAAQRALEGSGSGKKPADSLPSSRKAARKGASAQKDASENVTGEDIAAADRVAADRAAADRVAADRATRRKETGRSTSRHQSARGSERRVVIEAGTVRPEDEKNAVPDSQSQRDAGVDGADASAMAQADGADASATAPGDGDDSRMYAGKHTAHPDAGRSAGPDTAQALEQTSEASDGGAPKDSVAAAEEAIKKALADSAARDEGKAGE